jgi:hypothetical protein
VRCMLLAMRRFGGTSVKERVHQNPKSVNERRVPEALGVATVTAVVWGGVERCSDSVHFVFLALARSQVRTYVQRRGYIELIGTRPSFARIR